MGMPNVKNVGKLALLLGLMLGLGGCYDRTPEYKAEFTVKNADGIPIQNALVRVFAPVDVAPGSNAPVDFYLYTNESGKASLTYGYKAFFEVHSQKGSFRGCTYIELFENETVQKTVILRAFNDPNNGCPVN